MDLGAFTSGLLTGLREGVEAALIVAIVLAYLAKTGNIRYASRVWLGAGAALATSLIVGIVLFMTVGGLQSPYEQIFEGITMLVAAAVVTWMLFWMRRQAASVKGELQAAVDRALTEGSIWGLVLLAFTAVIREGIETSLFLVGQVNSADDAASSVLVGALVGLVIAVAIGYVFYQGTRRINLGSFFRWTGIGLIFIAAGLLSHAIHEFIEVGIITVGTQTAFDISAVLPHEDGVGQFLRALFGYTSTPEVITLVAWATYIVVVLALFLRPVRRRPAPIAAATSQVVRP
ncbi:MAG TPA: iron uptake transporter permease EfeU [Methylomirabilota bacterium]|nr:iron uptake transporter permease EfeU [Methylomirabilota bacterium]